MGPGTIDLSPAVGGKPASLRFAAFPPTTSITPSLFEEANIQGTKDTKEGKSFPFSWCPCALVVQILTLASLSKPKVALEHFTRWLK
jgi:hypothetical protein